jgi:hypothetical protein
MMLRAPETEALHEGSAQKGFGVSSLDGSLVPLGSTAFPRSLPGHIAREVERGEAPDAIGLKTLDQEAKQSKTNEYQ